MNVAVDSLPEFQEFQSLISHNMILPMQCAEITLSHLIVESEVIDSFKTIVGLLLYGSQYYVEFAELDDGTTEVITIINLDGYQGNAFEN